MSLQGRVPAEAAPPLRLGDLPEVERRAIRLLRLWRDGPAGRNEARITAGGVACLRLDALIRLLATPPARPLRIAAPGASGVVGDEGLLARAVCVAQEDAHEEAALAFGLLVPAATAQEAARLAGALGRALRAASGAQTAQRAYLIAGRPVTPRAAGAR